MTNAELPKVIHLRPRATEAAGGTEPDAVLTETPTAYDWMSERAATWWGAIAPLVELRPSELPEFAAYMETLAEYEESTEMIKDTALVVADPDTGLPMPNPLTGVRDRADRKIAFWASRFRRSR
ncbi:terminase small subunit [Gordonia phage ObLaDi]|uniref:Terminase small subunit n=3 Tax=Cafassovirus TaxID=3425056 RepID=A0A9E7TY98_9CAUD|nr:terminase small subunit [Gordonia phage Cafasso]UVK59741.1 terminase small subunit [Gordonia phage Aleemily]UXE03724.1 terminase small subunit [Gordonia phage ObLaDi]